MPRKISKFKNDNQKEKLVINLPYAEEALFNCNHWLKKDPGKNTLNQLLQSEGNNLLSKSINLRLNPVD